ncbi:MAG: hypothetical protein PHW11_00825 [Anaerolineaceae bacterium]|jgi:curved DNA-binding protein CbpA|nr:hypothetical protein [Anaerolineaceae bacterium]MDD4043480.1 hypothetical protein [Anaerolineaceae bacterium]MDD4578730.1 hypothetical protein [Anaerolineaceae bacterium]
MINYYELLRLQNNAQQVEIENRLDEQYQKWRALVTHHDPAVVTQANQALQTIEQARAVLLDPLRRQDYNRKLSEELATSAGLLDPDLVLTQPSYSGAMMTGTPMIEAAAGSPASIDRTDAWICQNEDCGKANPIGTTYCVKCGASVGKNCPNCNVMVEAANTFCSSCGVDKLEFFEANKRENIASLRKQINTLQEDINLATSRPGKYAQLHSSQLERKGNCLITLVSSAAWVLVFALGDWNLTALILGLIVFFIILTVLSLLQNKNAVAARVEDSLKPQILELERLISEVKKETY